VAAELLACKVCSTLAVDSDYLSMRFGPSLHGILNAMLNPIMIKSCMPMLDHDGFTVDLTKISDCCQCIYAATVLSFVSNASMWTLC